MAKDIDKLALCCNIMLEKLIYLYTNTIISKQQLWENSQLKRRFLIDNIDSIGSDELRSRSIKNLSQLNDVLTIKKKTS